MLTYLLHEMKLPCYNYPDIMTKVNNITKNSLPLADALGYRGVPLRQDLLHMIFQFIALKFDMYTGRKLVSKTRFNDSVTEVVSDNTLYPKIFETK